MTDATQQAPGESSSRQATPDDHRSVGGLAAEHDRGGRLQVETRRTEPWIETREGMLFFVNALFVIPEYCVLFPLGLRTLLRGLGLSSGRPSVFLDTLPTLATHFLPYVGWILLLPIGLVFKNFRVDRSWGRRGVLTLFLLSHVGFLRYTVYLWFGI